MPKQASFEINIVQYDFSGLLDHDFSVIDDKQTLLRAESISYSDHSMFIDCTQEQLFNNRNIDVSNNHSTYYIRTGDATKYRINDYSTSQRVNYWYYINRTVDVVTFTTDMFNSWINGITMPGFFVLPELIFPSYQPGTYNHQIIL